MINAQINRRRGLLVFISLLFALVGLAGCGGSTDSAIDSAIDSAVDSAIDGAGIRLFSVEQAAEAHQNRSSDLIVLDVRTAEEFQAGHLDGATMLDFYQADFADQLAALDPEASYLIYCRSGNRSGQTRTLMEGLGFTDVIDIDGGIQAWQKAGQPVVQ